MAENLRTTSFNDGTPISLVTDKTQWAGLTAPGYCWYNNDETIYKPVYGALYNWYALDTISNGGKDVCPIGWHPPSFSEWSELISFIGGEHSGGKLMESGTSHWPPPNFGANNETGFTGLPGGLRLSTGFDYVGLFGYYYSTSIIPYTGDYIYSIRLEAYLDEYYGAQVTTGDAMRKNEGASVRCIMTK